MTFKDLAIGQQFEFDHSMLQFHGGLAHGPWIKLSPRRYSHLTDAVLGNCRVGSISVKVRLGDSCGCKNNC